MQQMREPHLAQRIVVLVERRAVETERDAAAAFDHLLQRRDARPQMQVRAGVDRDRRTALGDQLQLFGPRPGAMRERQPRTEEADPVEEFEDAARIVGVEPRALGAGFEQVHVNAATGALRRVGNRFKQFVRAPLHRLRTILHVEHRIGRGRGHRIDQCDLLFDRKRRAQIPLLDLRVGRRRKRGEDRLRRPVNQRVTVAHRDRKAHPHADIARRARDLGHLGRQISQALDAGVVHHDGRRAAERAARQRHRARKIRIDRRQQRQIGDPGFQRLARTAISRGRGDAGMIVGVGQRRKRQQASGSAGLCRLDRDDAIAVDPDDVRARGGRRGVRLDICTRQFTHRHRPGK